MVRIKQRRILQPGILFGTEFDKLDGCLRTVRHLLLHVICMKNYLQVVEESMDLSCLLAYTRYWKIVINPHRPAKP
jgi:hypothetical protein